MLQFEGARVGVDELVAVEGLPEPFGGLSHLFLELLLLLGYPVLYQHIGPVAFLAILIVDKRIVEGA